jgi:gamma-butyrobetaine dioxygenase
MSVERFEWTDAEGPSRLQAGLGAAGAAVIRFDDLAAVAREAAGSPWAFAARLFGARPQMVEHQPIRPLPDGRTFATGSMPAPFHTDSQTYLGVPPHVQLMLCVRPAREGGENRFYDSWALLERLERDDPELLAQLFSRHRRIPFVFGDFFGPTVAWRGESLVFTQAASVPSGDAVAGELVDWLERLPAIELRCEAGELVAIHNHRMLHGRRAFEDRERQFLRLLVWLPAPFPAPPRFAAQAVAVRDEAQRRLQHFSGPVRRRFGLEDSGPAVARHRLALVLEMLRGNPPGQIARREKVPEPELYRWRDAVLAAALAPLMESTATYEQELIRALEELR